MRGFSNATPFNHQTSHHEFLEVLGPKDKTRHLGAIISRDPDVAPWENALAKALARLKAWSNRNLSIHNRSLIVHTMIVPTVEYVLSAAPAPTHALHLLERRVRVPVGWC